LPPTPCPLQLGITALAGALLACAGTAAAEPVAFVDGPAEIVFDAAVDGCAAWDIPDTPARAWRDGSGRVHLLSGSERSRAAVGPALEGLSRDCAVLFEGRHADDPGAYDDRVWLHATYALEDGKTVLGLAHVEYHGHERPERCDGSYLACWRNAVVELVSTDGGRSFRRPQGSRGGLVAALPYRFDHHAGRRTGYFNPSNIVRRRLSGSDPDGEFLYAFVFAEAWEVQARGACLIRRPVAGGPGDWRGWDGAGFTVRFADPYREDVADPAAHVCAPLPGISSTISGVVARPDGRGFLLVTAATLPDPAAGADAPPRSGVWAMSSPDLVAWSAPTLLFEAPLLWRHDCDAPAAYAYPSLLDDSSPSRNFEVADDRLWIYLVEMPLTPAAAGNGCRVGADRRLVRMPLRWPAAADED
jgi:hypothetical protein